MSHITQPCQVLNSRIKCQCLQSQTVSTLRFTVLLSVSTTSINNNNRKDFMTSVRLGMSAQLGFS